MKHFCFGCLLIWLSLIGVQPLMPRFAAGFEQARNRTLAAARPYWQPTAAIYDVINAIDRDDQARLAHIARSMQRPASLTWLMRAWQHVHHPPRITLGPYRTADWSMPGARLTIPLRLACNHHGERLDVVVMMTVFGWQVVEIRPVI